MRKIVGFYDVSIPFQVPLLNGGYEVSQWDCFLMVMTSSIELVSCLIVSQTGPLEDLISLLLYKCGNFR